jgi:hypothetical protein
VRRLLEQLVLVRVEVIGLLGAVERRRLGCLE